MKARWFALLVCAFASAGELAQLEGEVVATAGLSPGALWAELDAVGGSVVSRTPVDPDGRFALAAVPAGSYTLRILDAASREFASQAVSLRQDIQRVTVPLREPESTPVSAEKVSVAELRHQPTKKARRSAREAEKLAARGDHVRAAAALEKAIALDPQYIQAHGNLGAEYLVLHRYAEAVVELQRAVALDPAAAWLQSNLAMALWETGKPAEAEQWARHAVSIDGRNAKSRYLLGWILLRRPDASAEGVEELQRAARDVPAAHRTLADFYRATGQTVLARREIERYREADPTANQKEIEGWLASLR